MTDKTAIRAYPLTWPEGFKRRLGGRIGGPFKSTLSAALSNVQTSLRLFARDSGKKLDSIVISSNVTLGVQRPADPGVAVWFYWDGMQVCIPVDRYDKVEANLQAIHHILEARRTELRHGGLEIVRATFTGFLMLPPPITDWRAVLGSDVNTLDVLEHRYKHMRSLHHPDKGGNATKFDEVQRAYAQGKQELSA